MTSFAKTLLLASCLALATTPIKLGSKTKGHAYQEGDDEALKEIIEEATIHAIEDKSPPVELFDDAPDGSEEEAASCPEV